MSVTGLLTTTLTQTGFDVAMDIYTGDNKPYIVYNIDTESNESAYDDTPKLDTVYAQVHLYCDTRYDCTQLKKQIKSLLFDTGFSYAKVTLNTIETDTMLRHICFETNISQESEV